MAEDEPMVSVIVCTRDRPASLERMLDSCCALRVPDGLSWELIVVDNGSGAGIRERTAAVVASFAGRLPIRRVVEPRPGLSHARNCGVDTAKGVYLCWTDDDVLVDPGWIEAYCEAFARHPDGAVFGGRIEPRLEPPQTRWFARYMDRWPLDGVVARRDFGEEVVALDHRTHVLPWGANYAVRAREQRRLRYNVELIGSGEETDLVCRILNEGTPGYWVPASIVTHLIPASRQTRRYVLDYYRARGREIAYLSDTAPADSIHHNPRWVSLGPLGLRGACLASLGISIAAQLVGWTSRSLCWWAMHGYARGIIGYRRARAS